MIYECKQCGSTEVNFTYSYGIDYCVEYISCHVCGFQLGYRMYYDENDPEDGKFQSV